MLEFLRSWIINIVTISIVLILIEILVPSGKIKKIIALVSGFIMLIAVINPFLSFKSKGFDLSKTAMTDSFFIDKKEMETGSRLLEEAQMKQISSVYKNKLCSRIQEETNRLEGVLDSKATVEINEDYKSEKFGEITKVSVELTKGDKKKVNLKNEPVVSVEKIEIGVSSSRKVKDETIRDKLKIVDPEDKRLTELVKQSLNKTLEVNEDNIVVTIL